MISCKKYQLIILFVNYIFLKIVKVYENYSHSYLLNLIIQHKIK